MFVLKEFLFSAGLPLLVAGLSTTGSGCRFSPETGDNGYQRCDVEPGCPGGFACLDGLCVPDCQALDQIAFVGPSEEDYGQWICSVGAECEVRGLSDDGPARVEAVLSSGDFVELGPDEFAPYPGACIRLLVQVAFLAEQASEGRELTVLLIGNKEWQPVWGVGKDITLTSPVAGGDVEREFRKNTVFLMVNMENFGWPIRIRILPSDAEDIRSSLTFAVRDFRMYCCLEEEG